MEPEQVAGIVKSLTKAQREAELVKGMRYILPYLEWTIGRESPGHHPTMPSAVAEFRATLAKHQEGEGNA